MSAVICFENVRLINGDLLLHVWRIQLEQYGRQGFASAGSTVGSLLPLELRSVEKTDLF